MSISPPPVAEVGIPNRRPGRLGDHADRVVIIPEAKELVAIEIERIPNIDTDLLDRDLVSGGTFSPWPLSLVDRADSLLLNVGE